MVTNRTGCVGSSSQAGVRIATWRRPLAASILLGSLAMISPAMSPPVQAAAPRVAIVVGPAGTVTSDYRALAADAANAARDAGAQVTEVYSPNATWPAARAAIQGASLVVYLGHGNGWPSRYSNSLNPETQNGLGLNPVAGLDDTGHRYFGEKYLAREVRLAPNAIVVLARLCYASGNSEPGLAEGTPEMARARADNFAAGFLAAGAGAVVADAFARPSYYVRAILTRSGTGNAASPSIESIWRRSPTFHGHVRSFMSARTPGATELLDPFGQTSGFYRSLVGRLDLHAAEVVGSAVVSSPAAVVAANSGPAVGSLTLAGRPVTGASLSLSVGLAGGNDIVTPTTLGVGTRWIPLDVDADAPGNVAPQGPTSTPSPVADARTSATPASTAGPSRTASRSSATPSGSAAPSGSPVPSVSPAPSGSAAGGSVWSIDGADAIAAEEPAGIVAVALATRIGDAFVVPVVAPGTAGLYRLVVTLFDSSGAAFDAETQQAVPAAIVPVAAPLEATVSAPRELAVEASAQLALPVTVGNPGSLAWAPDAAPAGPGLGRGPGRVTLVGRWLALDPLKPGAAPLTASIAAPEPGGTAAVVLAGRAPVLPGDYLLELDLVSPSLGSLAWSGALDTLLVRLTVVARTPQRQ